MFYFLISFSLYIFSLFRCFFYASFISSFIHLIYFFHLHIFVIELNYSFFFIFPNYYFTLFLYFPSPILCFIPPSLNWIIEALHICSFCSLAFLSNACLGLKEHLKNIEIWFKDFRTKVLLNMKLREKFFFFIFLKWQFFSFFLEGNLWKDCICSGWCSSSIDSGRLYVTEVNDFT